VTFTSMPGLLNATGIARGWKEETFVPGSPWATAPMVTEPLLARLRRQGPEPLFLYVHYTDAHAPYGAPAVKGDEHERYMFQVGVIDGQIGRIRKAIADAGLDARATLILSADHGEAFGEHDQHYHATTVYEELLRVPLMVRLPGAAPAVVTDPVSLIDLGPTLLDLMGARTPASFMGQSLVPYLRGGRARLTRPLVAESSRGKLAMITGTVKVIDDVRVGTCEVYDLAADKAEAVNLIDKPAYAGAARCAQLESFRAEHELHRPGYVTPFVR
jgi:arylsulfatase A-like enzyme